MRFEVRDFMFDGAYYRDGNVYIVMKYAEGRAVLAKAIIVLGRSSRECELIFSYGGECWAAPLFSPGHSLYKFTVLLMASNPTRALENMLDAVRECGRKCEEPHEDELGEPLGLLSVKRAPLYQAIFIEPLYLPRLAMSIQSIGDVDLLYGAGREPEVLVPLLYTMDLKGVAVAYDALAEAVGDNPVAFFVRAARALRRSGVHPIFLAHRSVEEFAHLANYVIESAGSRSYDEIINYLIEHGDREARAEASLCLEIAEMASDICDAARRYDGVYVEDDAGLWLAVMRIDQKPGLSRILYLFTLPDGEIYANDVSDIFWSNHDVRDWIEASVRRKTFKGFARPIKEYIAARRPLLLKLAVEKHSDDDRLAALLAKALLLS